MTQAKIKPRVLLSTAIMSISLTGQILSVVRASKGTILSVCKPLKARFLMTPSLQALAAKIRLLIIVLRLLIPHGTAPTLTLTRLMLLTCAHFQEIIVET